MPRKLIAIGLIVLAGASAWAKVSAAAPAVAPGVTLQASGMKDQDDMTFWLHPRDPALSTVITSDKAANKVFVYDLEGRVLQSLPAQKPANIDTRYGFRLGSQLVDVVALNERGTEKLRVYKVDPASRRLEQVDDGRIDSGPNYGFSLYKSRKTGKLYAFSSKEESRIGQLLSRTQVKQYELIDDGRGRVTSRGVLRELRLGSLVEGMVADDETGQLYVGEETVGVWKFAAEPDGPVTGTRIAAVGENGLTADVEGVTIYPKADGRGYLIVSSQGSNSFNVYDRQPPHRYLGAFTLSGVEITDGIDVANLPLGPKFPQGAFASHNGRASPYPVHLTRWEEIAAQLKLPVETPYWDARTLQPWEAPTMLAAAPQPQPQPQIVPQAQPQMPQPPARPAMAADTIPPMVSAALVAAGKVDDDEGRFHVQAACSDNAGAGVMTEAHLNGVPVANGQAVKLELDDKTRVKQKKMLKMKAPAFHLVVSCRDAAGNVTTAAASPAFAAN